MSPTMTNKYGLPDVIVKAVQRKVYDKGDADFTGSELPKPPLLRRLEMEHWNEIEEDVVERIWALFGDSIHYVLEQAATTELVEDRLSHFIDVDGMTYTVGGKIDHINLVARKLEDWKTTTVWALKDGVKPEWEAQTNVYAWILRMKGIEIDEIWIGAFFKDWSRTERLRYGNSYPETPIGMYPVRLWPMDEARAWIADRIIQHTATNPRDCTDEERWARPTTYALMKEGRKSAVRVMDTYGEITQYAIDNGHAGLRNAGSPITMVQGYSIEERPGSYVRCTEGNVEGKTFCPVSQWCPVMHPELRPQPAPPGESHQQALEI